MNIWIPRVQFWSMHPFAVAASSWHSATGQMHLDFFVQTRKGFTRRLFQSCHESATVERFVLFSGPHGTPIKHTSANTVIMVATGMGIWPMLTYIEDMVHTNRSQCSTSKIILVYITKKLCMSERLPCLTDTNHGQLRLYKMPSIYNYSKGMRSANSCILGQY